MTPKSTQSTSRVRSWLGNGLAALVTLALLGSGISKLAHIPKVIAGLTHAGLPDAAILPIGILELSCLTLYLIPRTSILGTFLLTGYLGGAIVTHIIARETLAPPAAHRDMDVRQRIFEATGASETGTTPRR